MTLPNDIPSSQSSFEASPRIEWSRILGGKPPGSIRVFLAPQGLLLSIEVSLKQPVCSVVCFDWEGQIQWARPDTRGWLALPAVRYLVSTSTGQPAIVNREGEIVKTFDQTGITQAAFHGDLLVMGHDRQVWAVDQDLRPAWRFTWPGERAAEVSCLVDGVFYYIDEDAVWSCTPGGRASVFAPLPQSLMQDAYDEFNSLTRRATELPPISPTWRGLSFDAGLNCFFLNNFMPHVVVCVDRSGRVRWRRCLGPGCCGGAPYALPNGNYAVSGGCNGVISWLDTNGQLLFQSLLGQGTGLATAYSREVVVLPDGTIVANGGRGLIAFGPACEHLWTWPNGAIDCVYEAARKVLVCSSWRERDAQEATGYVEILRMADAGGAVSDDEPKDVRGEIASRLHRC